MLSTDLDGRASGARYIGLGETGAAASGMPESPIWNPAALRDLAEPMFSADFDVARQSQLDEEILIQGAPLRGRKLTYLGFASADGAFFYRPLASFKQRTITNPADPANNFTDEHLKVDQFGFSSAQEGEKDSIYGVNLSFLHARRGIARAATGTPPTLEIADGNGFSLDIGFQGRGEHLAWGLAFFNVPGILYWNLYDPDQLPVLMRGGVAFKPVPAFGFYTDYEKRYYRGGLPKPDFLHIGTEVMVLPWLALRGGTFGDDLNDVDKTSYTGGFSALSKAGHQLDFALKSYRVNSERVYNYFISLILPMPKSVAVDQ